MGWGFSLRASSPGRSCGGAGKGRRDCNYVSEFEFHLQFPCGSQSTGAVRILPISAKRKRARMYYFIEEEEKHLRIDTFTIASQKIQHPRVILNQNNMYQKTSNLFI